MLITLIIISALCIIINGKTYTVKISDISDIDGLIVDIEKENIVKCVEKNFNNGVLSLTFDAISKGKTYVNIEDANGDSYSMFSMYVHEFGIITYATYFGDSTGSIIIPISISIFLAYVIIFNNFIFRMHFNKYYNIRNKIC